MGSFLIRYLKPILAVLAVLLLVLAGYLFRGVLADRAELERMNESLITQNDTLWNQILAEREATSEAIAIAQTARQRAGEARGALNKAQGIPEAREWSETPLPPSIQEALR